AEDGEASGAAVARVCERRWRGGDGDHDGHCADCEVHSRSMGDGAADTYADLNHDGGEAALFAREAGDGGSDTVESGESGGADRRDSDGAVGPDFGESVAIRAAAVQ